MKIGIGNDHIAYELKIHVKEYLTRKGHEVIDYGADSAERTDYPIYAKKVALAVLGGEVENGVLICGTGIGISIAANKFAGIRDAVCSDPVSARFTKEHNNANIIAFGSRIVGSSTAEMILDEFLNGSYEGGRHQPRLDMISAIEQGRFDV